MKVKSAKQEKLFTEYYPIVKNIAKKYLNWNEPVADLIQIGSLGLLKAFKKYNSKEKNVFTSYAASSIAGEIRHYIRDKYTSVKISRKLIELNTKVNKITQEAFVITGKTLTNEQISKKLKVKTARIIKAKDAVRTHLPISLNQPITSLKSSAANIITLEDTLGIDADYENILEKVNINSALDTLPQRNRNIIKMLFLEDKLQSEVAKAHKITQAQVSRVIKQSLGELKNILA